MSRELPLRPNRAQKMRFWLTRGMGVKRFVALMVLGGGITLLGGALATLWLFDGQRQAIAEPLERFLQGETWRVFGGSGSFLLLLGGIALISVAISLLNRSLLSNWMTRPNDVAELLHRRVMLARGPRVVAFGGGTGLSLLLRGLRSFTSNITAVVAISDDGGSSGRLRSSLGMPAPGDLVDCIAALSIDEASLGRLLSYRFERGNELKGHTFGNLLLATLHETEKDFGEALRVAQRVLDLQGAVWPAANEPVTLRVEKASGIVLEGESNLSASPGAVRRVSLIPEAPSAPPEAIMAIAEADLIVLGPGSLFTSILPPLLVPEMAAALRSSKADLVLVLNIMTEAGETDGFDAWAHAEAIERHLGRRLNRVVHNSTEVDQERRLAYLSEGAEVVTLDRERFAAAGIKVDHWPLLGPKPYAQHNARELASRLIEGALHR
jgi:uncharacterized cofD-like protein